jgi:hypothetical protein
MHIRDFLFDLEERGHCTQAAALLVWKLLTAAAWVS